MLLRLLRTLSASPSITAGRLPTTLPLAPSPTCLDLTSRWADHCAQSGDAHKPLQLNQDAHRLSGKQSSHVRRAEGVCPDVCSLRANLY